MNDPGFMKTAAIIGAGPMGLTVAYRLAVDGWRVDIYERDDRIGGMTASFDFGGLSLERYYHFICSPDRYTFNLLDELDLSAALRWTHTRMGFFYQGKLYPWGDPIKLLTFPGLDPLSKLRYALHTFYVSRLKDVSSLDLVEASQWLTRFIGPKAYDALWRFLFEKKFHQYSRPLSAAWIATRIRRVAQSRKNMFVERLGYLDGGSETLLNRLQGEIEARGGRIHLNAPIHKVPIENGRAIGVKIADQIKPADLVVSTIPMPYVSAMIPDLPRSYTDAVDKIKNIGVVCVVIKLSHKLTDYFWLNTNDNRVPVPGLIEYSNLRPLNEHILYAPFYLPADHALAGRPLEVFIEDVKRLLSLINTDFKETWVLDARAFYYKHAQPICPPGFYEQLPPYETGVADLYVADTTHSYPEDRSINESIRVAEEIYRLIKPTA